MRSPALSATAARTISPQGSARCSRSSECESGSRRAYPSAARSWRLRTRCSRRAGPRTTYDKRPRTRRRRSLPKRSTRSGSSAAGAEPLQIERDARDDRELEQDLRNASRDLGVASTDARQHEDLVAGLGSRPHILDERAVLPQPQNPRVSLALRSPARKLDVVGDA